MYLIGLSISLTSVACCYQRYFADNNLILFDLYHKTRLSVVKPRQYRVKKLTFVITYDKKTAGCMVPDKAY